MEETLEIPDDEIDEVPLKIIEYEISCKPRPNSKAIWAEIENEFYEHRRQIAEYDKSKNPELTDLPVLHPRVAYLNRVIFPTLNKALAEMLRKFTEQQCFFAEEEFLFNGLDFLSEYLWNRNPWHPRRHTGWSDITTIALYWRTPK